MQLPYFGACIVLCVITVVEVSAGTKRNQSQTLHQEIGQELLMVRKEYSQLQPRIYEILDKIERLHNHLKAALHKKRAYKKEKVTIASECKKLQEEAAFLQASLETTSLELEQTRVLLEQERKKEPVAHEEKAHDLETTTTFTQQPLMQQQQQKNLGKRQALTRSARRTPRAPLRI